jgi:tellurite resistance protein TehA-like permease
MKPWRAAAVVTGVVVVTLVLLLALDSRSADEELAPSASEIAVTVSSLVIFVFGVLWLLFAVLRVRRERRDGVR